VSDDGPDEDLNRAIPTSQIASSNALLYTYPHQLSIVRSANTDC
jgi:hypothetical protein